MDLFRRLDNVFAFVIGGFIGIIVALIAKLFSAGAWFVAVPILVLTAFIFLIEWISFIFDQYVFALFARIIGRAAGQPPKGSAARIPRVTLPLKVFMGGVVSGAIVASVLGPEQLAHILAS